MKKFFSSKILVLFTVFLCVLTLLVCPVFAVDSSVLPNDIKEELNGHGELKNFESSDYYFMLYNHKKNFCYLYYGPSECLIRKTSDGFWEVNSSDGIGRFYGFVDDGDGRGFGLTLNYVLTSWRRLDSSPCEDYDIFESNYVIKDYETNEVFSTPPLTGTLAPIMEKTPMEEVLKEIMEILPVVLLTLVGLIGLRKALAFLSTVLHQS